LKRHSLARAYVMYLLQPGVCYLEISAFGG
jgi:hypothetical protein